MKKDEKTIKFLSGIKTTNGYKVNMMAYIYGHYSNPTPKLFREFNDVIIEFRHVKFISGKGQYEKVTMQKYTDEKGFQWAKTVKVDILEENKRFSLKKLINFAEKETTP